MRFAKAPLLCVVLTVTILIVMAVQRASWSSPGSSAAFADRVAAAIDAVPARVGPWTGEAVVDAFPETPALQPVVRLARRYRHDDGGEVDLRVSYCPDRRDVTRLDPQVRYRTRGWMPDGVAYRTLDVGGRAIPVAVHRFHQSMPGRRITTEVVQVVVGADGACFADAAALADAVASPEVRGLGAAQIEIAGVVPTASGDATAALLAACEGVLEAMDSTQAGPRG